MYLYWLLYSIATLIYNINVNVHCWNTLISNICRHPTMSLFCHLKQSAESQGCYINLQRTWKPFDRSRLAMWLSPKSFACLFTYRAVSTSDVLNCLHIPMNLDSGDEVTLSHLWRFIMDSSEEGNHLYLFKIC